MVAQGTSRVRIEAVERWEMPSGLLPRFAGGLLTPRQVCTEDGSGISVPEDLLDVRAIRRRLEQRLGMGIPYGGWRGALEEPDEPRDCGALSREEVRTPLVGFCVPAAPFLRDSDAFPHLLARHAEAALPLVEEEEETPNGRCDDVELTDRSAGGMISSSSSACVSIDESATNALSKARSPSP
jgi:hypothetical protein